MHRPKLVHWNESVHCTPIDRAFKKCDSTRGQAAYYNQPFLIHGSFSKINCAMFEQNKCKIWEDFEQCFVTKQGFFLPKVQKKYNFEYNSYTTYI